MFLEGRDVLSLGGEGSQKRRFSELHSWDVFFCCLSGTKL